MTVHTGTPVNPSNWLWKGLLFTGFSGNSHQRRKKARAMRRGGFGVKVKIRSKGDHQQ